MEHFVKENLKTVKQQMELACQASGRQIEDVKLLLATKTVPLEKLQMAIQAGRLYSGKTKHKNYGANFRLCSSSIR